ncbi:MAG: DegT/DnrJ/EryC1/StrS family aminotransferase [Myxococcota bacterium]
MSLGAKTRLQGAALEELVRRHRLERPIYVTRPTLPDREAYQAKLATIWESGWLTNEGDQVRELTRGLAGYLGVEHLSLCCNGTVALLIALQSFRVTSGEVITTPFTFPATAHSLYWNRVQPVFCDIEESTFNLDPERIEALIGPDTKAILPVHVFGNPCDVEGIQAVADKHGLLVLYDAAHVMGVRYDGRSISAYGDSSILSFHATKLFSTIEGGAIVAGSAAQRQRIDYLKNFGIEDEHTVIGPGINGKMNEFQAAFGLLQLETIEDEISRRRELTRLYRDRLGSVPGIRVQHDLPRVRHNYAYFPVLIDAERFGMSRDGLHASLESLNIHTRKYFHPLCSQYACYSTLPSAHASNLPIAERVAERVLCLPLYGTLEAPEVTAICDAILALHELGSSVVR